jgi:hypothetical protein
VVKLTRKISGKDLLKVFHKLGFEVQRGLVLLLPDPPEVEAMSLEVAERLGATVARIRDLNHCWMAEAPEVVAPVLERFWSSMD